jgi:hypothetical protein
VDFIVFASGAEFNLLQSIAKEYWHAMCSRDPGEIKHSSQPAHQAGVLSKAQEDVVGHPGVDEPVKTCRHSGFAKPEQDGVAGNIAFRLDALALKGGEVVSPVTS